LGQTEEDGAVVLLPTGDEVDNGTLIDNDVDNQTPGFFAANITQAGEVQGSGVTVTSQGNLLADQDFIFDYDFFVYAAGQLVDLNANITQPPTLVGPDLVESRGLFQGPNGIVNYTFSSTFQNGVQRLETTVEFTSENPLGDIRVVSYLDEDVFAPSDDLLLVSGTPGLPDFRLVTIDDALRIGFAQAGVYQDGPGQENATFAGWAADQFNDLLLALQNGTQQFSVPGVIDTVDLRPFNDPVLGDVFGLEDVTTALAWDVNDDATSSTVTNYLVLAESETSALNPFLQISPGGWNGLTIREGASDRNVVAIREAESVGAVRFATNDNTGLSQFVGELAPDLDSGDENRRLGFVIDG
ncbi:MAG: hypothetical protein AAFN70_20330, partial [Planctomycetota bacterium]